MKIAFFNNRVEFRDFLNEYHQKSTGIWIKLDKRNTSNKLTAQAALEEALCFGWIDSTIKSLDSDFYLKYFTHRNKKSRWSTRNKELTTKLKKENKMTIHGLKEIELAKADGRWEIADSLPVDFDLEAFTTLIMKNDEAYKNFKNMSKSIQKIYAASYFYLKKTVSRERQLKIIFERLEQNFPPMF